MDITMDLILDNLSGKYTLYGHLNDTPLKQPELFNPNKHPEKGGCYVSTVDLLPPKPEFNREMLLICVGGMPWRVYSKGNFPVIWVENAAIYEVFNEVQTIYERYRNWSQSLQHIINTNVDYTEMARISMPILQNPIAILDNQFYHLALTTYSINGDGTANYAVDSAMFPLPIERIKKVNMLREQHKQQNDIYFPEEGICCCNLYLTGRHMGTVTMGSRVRPFRESDFKVFRYFSKMVELAMTKHSAIKTAQTATFKSVVHDYLCRNPVSSYRLQHVTKEGQQFICFKILRTGTASTLPVNYICTTLEELLTGCAVMEFESCIMGILDFSIFPYDYEKFEEILSQYLEEMGFKAGLSGIFQDIRQIYYYHRQAVCAFETGFELHPEINIYRFFDYLLPYTLHNCVGEFPLEYMLPPSLQKLLKASEESDVDYWGTLRSYLDNSMNASKAARDLFLHRSSFLFRMERIWKILGTQLEDPKERLLIHMMLHAVDWDRNHTD